MIEGHRPPRAHAQPSRDPIGVAIDQRQQLAGDAQRHRHAHQHDGDDVADVRTILLQGLDSSDTHHAANNLIYGPDGAIYICDIYRRWIVPFTKDVEVDYLLQRL